MSNTKNYSWKGITDIFNAQMQIEIAIENLLCGRLDLLRTRAPKYPSKPESGYCNVWTKTYVQTISGAENSQTIRDNKFPEAISQHELKMLQDLAQRQLHHVSRTYVIEQSFETGASKNIVRTRDAGPSLDYWLNMRQFLQHPPFSQPVAFLRLARGILQALAEFHENGYIHLDLRSDNVCMPSSQFTLNDDLTSATLEPDWDAVKLIDFAYSLSKHGQGIYPDVMFKHGYTERFNKLMDTIEWRYVRPEYAKRPNSNVGAADCRAARYNPDWWRASLDRSKTLRRYLEQLDWREDIYQLGEILKEIRSCVYHHINPQVNDLVQALPELLQAEGLSEPAPSNLPHRDWIEQINNVLRICSGDMQETQVFHLSNFYSGSNFEKRPAPRHPAPNPIHDDRLESKDPPPEPSLWTQHVFTYLASVVTGLSQVARSVPSALRNYPLLALLAFSYPAFVLLAIVTGEDFIGLPMIGVAALTILIVLSLAVWKLTTSTRCFTTLGGLLLVLSYPIFVLLVSILDLNPIGFPLIGIAALTMLSVPKPAAWSQLWLERWHNLIVLRIKLTDLIQNTWASFCHNPFLVLLALSYLAFVLLTLVLGLDPIGLPVIGIAALTMLIALKPAAWKLMALLTDGATRSSSLLRRSTHTLRNFFTSRYLYPILLVPLAWGAENQYGLIAQAEKPYLVWQKARHYAEATQKIKLSGWWKGERAANTQESAWLKTTRQLSGFGWPQAMFMAALTRCYGMQDGGWVVLPSESNLADCAPLLDAALQQGAQRWLVLGNSSGWSAMLEDTVDVLNSTLYQTSPPTGSFRLAQALTPGLEAAAPYNDNLAYALADIQACRLKPSQHNNAVHTLQALIERFPDSELAKRAGEHLPGLERFCN